MNIYKLTPDKSLNFEIYESGKINLIFEGIIYKAIYFIAENESISRCYFYDRAMINENEELYIIECLSLRGKFAFIFRKNKWIKNKNGSYRRRVLEFYCDNNGLETIERLREISLSGRGWITWSVFEKEISVYQYLKFAETTKTIMEVFYGIESHNKLDFLIINNDRTKVINSLEGSNFESNPQGVRTY